MRQLRQIELIETSQDTVMILALDEDGYLWLGHFLLNRDLDPQWKALRGPSDVEPFDDDGGDRFDRFEKAARENLEKDDRLQRRLDSLPGIGDEDDEEPSPAPADPPIPPPVRPRS